MIRASARISRARRAELQRLAQGIRRSGQRARWDVERIAAAIQAELPELLPLEAWRLAYGWSRRQVIDAIHDLYRADGLAPPPVNSSMLCRWEHGEVAQPSLEYGLNLARLYCTDLISLGLLPEAALSPRYRHWQRTATWDGQMTSSDDTPLSALHGSIQLALEVEGPSGGPLVREHLQSAVDYYALKYSAFPSAQLAVEVHRTRALAGAMLRHPQTDTDRTEVRRLAGWLSALVGNLAYALAEPAAAQIHLSTAARLGTAVGEHHLICWALGAQAMVANSLQQGAEALDLSEQALEYADTPLRRAQIIAWAQLRSLANLGDRRTAARLMAEAQDQMDAAPGGDEPGRFGFDRAELQLHLAEVSLQLGDHDSARTHAQTSQSLKQAGGPGWAAATLTLARAEAARARYSDAAGLAAQVLDACPPDAIRETSRARLRDLDHDLAAVPGAEARDLRDRIQAMPTPVAVGRLSEEPNGL